MQNSSGFISSSEKSTQLNTTAFSLPACSWICVPGMTMWLARIFSVFSSRIKYLHRLWSLCCRTRDCPTPRSFHSFVSWTNLYSLHLMSTRTSSSSSPDLTSTSSSCTTGANSAAHSSSSAGASPSSSSSFLASLEAAGALPVKPPKPPVPVPNVAADPKIGVVVVVCRWGMGVGERERGCVWKECL